MLPSSQPIARVHSLLSEHLDLDVPFESIAPFAQGKYSTLYLSSHPPEPVLVKLLKPHHARDFLGYREHKAALDLWRAAGVPTPQVYSHGRTFCIEQYVGGNHASQLSLQPPDLAALFDDLANALDTIHSLPAACYGKLRSTHEKSSSSWTAYLERYLLLYDKILAACKHFPVSLREKAISSFQRELPYLAIQTPSSLHGDLHLYNFLTDGRKVTAVLDATETTGGDPYYDLAYFQRMCRTDPQFADFFSFAYPRANKEKLRAYQIWISLRRAALCAGRASDPRLLQKERDYLTTLF